MSNELREPDGGAVAADSQVRDFGHLPPSSHTSSDSPSDAVSQPSTADPLSTEQPSPHVRYALGIDTNVRNGGCDSPPRQSLGLARVDTDAPFSPSMRRRITRVGTFKTVEDFEDFSERPGWRPGAEPGFDPSKPDGGRGSMPTLHAPCDITVVDFSQDRFSMQQLNNETLNDFLNLPQPKWVNCRWINVNGLSWDVIQALGRHKNLHKLAIEDIMNTRNRTKAEWYPTHAFIVLTLQKLVQLCDPDSDDSDSDDDVSRISKRSSIYPKKTLRRLKRVFQGNNHNPPDVRLESGGGPYPDQGQNGNFLSGLSGAPNIAQVRTLQSYHASQNDERAQFMEKNSALAYKKLAIFCEQVSMFITNDNCIISFFEGSAQDVEGPILRRLQISDTIIRQSCDASMVGQAIIDAIIDLAIPAVFCYDDVIGDIELDVLNSPNISHTRKLYILIAEINKLLNFVTPITTLIQTLRDHKADVPLDTAMERILDPMHPVFITTQTYIYLGDVLDHCVLITDKLEQHKRSADGMIQLIFNTISANQNESMRQLTTATIIFLPLTFITGYFGQNFTPFNVLQKDIGYFWKIAVPVVFCTILILLWEPIYHYCRALLRRRYISRLKSRPRRPTKKRV